MLRITVLILFYVMSCQDNSDRDVQVNGVESMNILELMGGDS